MSSFQDLATRLAHSFLVGAALLALTSCYPVADAGLDPKAFGKALREEGFQVEGEKKLSLPAEGNASAFLMEAWSLRLPAGQGGDFYLLAYDLSTPEGARSFRATRSEVPSFVGGDGYRYENENLRLFASSRPDPEVIAVFRGSRPSIDLRQAGWFLYPLGICLAFATFVFMERWLALRRSRTMPGAIASALAADRVASIEAGEGSAAARIVARARHGIGDADDLRAYARLEVSGMERGLFLLEIVVGAAPLLGLLGTVTGLTKVFSGFPVAGAAPDAGVFSEGISMALLTTIIGLAIAIPALMAHAFLVRKVEKRAAELDWLVERLSGESNNEKEQVS
ncbi:MAG: MotA/TolQ/ExbB proton channel family protein [Opitutales bacterium]